MNSELIVPSARAIGAATILGQRAPRIPTGGKIRGGIMVLTRAASNVPEAREIYKKGVDAGEPFDAIEQQIRRACPTLQKRALVPQNVPWFTVRAADFANPAVAAILLEKYGEDRGNGERRLYRFPVIFPADQWQSVMPHQMEAWSGSERRFWSEYSPDGRTRYCKCFAPPQRDSKNRVVRVWGGRPTQLRPENDGLCQPNDCPQYQARECNLSGKFIFMIPGVASLDAFELHTNSFYAMSSAIEKFEQVAFMRGGRLSGFLDRNGASFYISKRLRNVSRINEDTGRPERTEQWIIELDADIDVTTLMRQGDEQALLQDARAAAQLLEGAAETAACADGVVRHARTTATAASSEHARAKVDEVIDRDGTTILGQRLTSRPVSIVELDEAAQRELEPLWAALARNDIDCTQFVAWADRQWGAGWKRNPNGRRRASEEVTRCEPHSLRAKLQAGGL